MEYNLAHLGLEYVDLLLLHGPSQAYGTQGVCQPSICDITRAQWEAYAGQLTGPSLLVIHGAYFHGWLVVAGLLKAGKAKAIGVSNFCPSCLACLEGGGAK